MKVLVTGASGFIGYSLASHFDALGRAVTRSPSLRESPIIANCAEPPAVIVHAAGSGTVGQVAAAPAREIPANLAAALAVLEYARVSAPATHVVLLSSAAVYGDAPALPQQEDQTRLPVSLYGLAKQQVEALGEHYAVQFGLRVSVVRLFSVYGEGLRKQLLWDAVRKFSVGEASFFGTGEETRDWVHVADVCGFVDSLIANPPAGYAVLNCGSQVGTSTRAMLTELATALGKSPPSFNGAVRAGDPRFLVADTSRARDVLGWQAKVSWQEGVRNYARWAKAVL